MVGAEGLFWGHCVGGEGCGEHFQGFAAYWRYDYRGAEEAAADPVLGGGRDSVGTEEGDGEAFVAVRVFDEGFAGADGHGVVLADDGLNVQLFGGAEGEPGLDGVVGAGFGPVSFKDFDFDGGGLGGEQAAGAQAGGAAVGRAFNVEDVARADEGGELLTLDASDFFLVGADHEDGNFGGAAQGGDVVGLAVEDDPSDAGGDGGFGDLRHGSANGFDHDGVGVVVAILNDFDELLSLIDGVIVSVDDVKVNAEAGGSGAGGVGLLELIVVVLGGEANDDAKFVGQGESVSAENGQAIIAFGAGISVGGG